MFETAKNHVKNNFFGQILYRINEILGHGIVHEPARVCPFPRIAVGIQIDGYVPAEEVVEADATDEEPLELEEEDQEVTGSMAAYTQAISRSIKK